MITDSPEEKVTLSRKWKRTWQRSLLWAIGIAVPLREKDNPVPIPRNILVFIQEKLGDAILTTPLFRNLKYLYPDIQIHIVLFHKASDIFRNDPNIYRIHNYKADKAGTIRELRKIKFDILFNTKDHPSLTFILLSRYLNADYKVGIFHPFHRNHYDHLLRIDFMAHTIEKNCSLLHILRSPHTNLNDKPYVPPGEISAEVETYLKTMPKKKLLGINLSAGSCEKEWPVEKWQELIETLAKQCIVLAVGPRLSDKAFLESNSNFVVPSPATRNIFEAAALVEQLDMLITPSTGLLHIASCFNTSVVGLYRHDPSDHKRFAPYGVPYRKVIAQDHRVADIDVIKVVRAAQALTEETIE